jgi:hypothetical protein
MAVKYYGAGGEHGGTQPIVSLLSTDTKPEMPFAEHIGLCIETDTNKLFIWDGNAWVKANVGLASSGMTGSTVLTQAEYDALSPPDAETLYMIVG